MIRAVRLLVARLEKDGCRIFFDEKDIPWGESIRRAITEGIGRSRHLILVLSRHAVASEWVASEMDIALWEDPANRRRTILPLVLDARCDVPARVRHLRHLDVSTSVGPTASRTASTPSSFVGLGGPALDRV